VDTDDCGVADATCTKAIRAAPGPVIANATLLENLPLRESHMATLAVPALATALAGTDAVACVLLSSVVGSFPPFHITVS
jgi:hypothetical protein